MWRIIFRNRKHCDIQNVGSAKEATAKAESLHPKLGKATLAIIDPPETIRHCPGCGQFLAKDHLGSNYCPECKGQKNWIDVGSDPDG